MHIKDLIGQSVSKIRYDHYLDPSDSTKKSQSQIKLGNGSFILFPPDAEDKVELESHYQENKSCDFDRAQRCGLAYRLAFRKKRIKDVYFKYENGVVADDSKGIIELENGKFIMEDRYHPEATSEVNLVVMNKKRFDELSKDGVQFRSWTSTRTS